MFKKTIFFFLMAYIYSAIFSIENEHSYKYEYDLTLMGIMRIADGIGKIPCCIIDCLKNTNLKINWIPPKYRFVDFTDLPESVKKVVLEKKALGKVIIFTDVLWELHALYSDDVPNGSIIKLAYSMLESTAIPPEWVRIINSKFDAIIVPDQFLVNVYQASGVRKPIFVIPLPIYLDNFLAYKPRVATKTFIFGNVSGAQARKNIPFLITAFNKAFGNSSTVKLRINSRWGEEASILPNMVKKLKVNNIEFTTKVLSEKEYFDFMSKIDCYVSFSMGEGFSISARESLALGKPTILSNNTAHTTICKSNYVYAVKPNNLKPAYYPCFGQTCGFQFDTLLKDAVESLQNVYTNYELYFQKALLGREWVKQYNIPNLTTLYLNLIKPNEIIFGKDNIVTPNYVMTNSKELYYKYKKLKQSYSQKN